MTAAAYGNVSDVEIIWVLIALVGFGYSMVNVKDALADRRFLNEHNIQNGRRALARYQGIAEILRAATQFIFLVIGLLAMFLPETPNSLDMPSTQVALRVAITYGLIASSIMLTIKSYLGYRVRQILTKGRP